jgi:hypothetical protein
MRFRLLQRFSRFIKQHSRFMLLAVRKETSASLCGRTRSLAANRHRDGGRGKDRYTPSRFRIRTFTRRWSIGAVRLGMSPSISMPTMPSG